MLRIIYPLLALLVISSSAMAQFDKISNWRPYDQKGVNIFETSKDDTIKFEGLKVRMGGHFAQQFQSLNHSNQALPNIDPATGKNLNQLIEIGSGFNLATANLNIDAQLADGIRLNLITYLSSRHHPEAWVKGGYVQIDKLTFMNSKLINNLMDYMTLKIGHMEINYGDAHFRRSDNGNAMNNPFVGNNIMDGFTTEIGAEAYFQNSKGFLAVVGVTNGEINGNITNPDGRAPSFYGKIGVDREIAQDLRLRITGSLYSTKKSANNTLFGSDRAGSRYYLVMENINARTSSQAWSARYNPNMRDKITAVMINPFVKYKGLELFGTYEKADGRLSSESEVRTWEQMSVESVYRFFDKENVFVGARYNKVKGELPFTMQKASIDRIQLGIGWFVTPNLLLKGEYVKQEYKDFPNTSILHQGEFDGIMIEAVIGF